MNKFLVKESASEPRIFQFLSSVDHEFVPPLSERVDLAAYSNKLAKKACNLFLEVGGVDAGHAAYYANDLERKVGFLSSICISPDLRGKGLAEALLEAVLEGAKRAGMEKLLLEVDAHNKAAIRFYKRNGFVDNGVNEMVYTFEVDLVSERLSESERNRKSNSSP